MKSSTSCSTQRTARLPIRIGFGRLDSTISRAEQRDCERSFNFPNPDVVIDQDLPDGHGVAPPANGLDDQRAIGFAGARPRRSAGAVLGRGGASPVPAGAEGAAAESVDTSEEMAGFAGRIEGRPRPRTTRPAAFR